MPHNRMQNWFTWKQINVPHLKRSTVLSQFMLAVAPFIGFPATIADAFGEIFVRCVGRIGYQQLARYSLSPWYPEEAYIHEALLRWGRSRLKSERTVIILYVTCSKHVPDAHTFVVRMSWCAMRKSWFCRGKSRKCDTFSLIGATFFAKFRTFHKSLCRRAVLATHQTHVH